MAFRRHGGRAHAAAARTCRRRHPTGAALPPSWTCCSTESIVHATRLLEMSSTATQLREKNVSDCRCWMCEFHTHAAPAEHCALIHAATSLPCRKGPASSAAQRWQRAGASCPRPSPKPWEPWRVSGQFVDTCGRCRHAFQRPFCTAVLHAMFRLASPAVQSISLTCRQPLLCLPVQARQRRP